MRVLIADDDSSIRWVIGETARKMGFSVDEAKDGKEALEKILRQNYDLIFIDIRMPEIDGITVIETASKSVTPSRFIVMTAVKSPEPAAKATALGVTEYLTKPFDLEDIEALLSSAKDKSDPNVKQERKITDGDEYLFGAKIVGTSRAIIELYREIGKIAPTDLPVLITGERGTGKELVARTIHELSPFSGGNFIPVNMAAVPEELIESELFGHEKGAFTGSVTTKPGKVEAAMGGSLFLDEIGETPPGFQAKILRFIQEKEFYRLGSNVQRKFKGRIIAATNRDLEELVKSGQFREDLYDRLNAFTLHLPPLRERKEDIPLLASFFVRKYSTTLSNREKTLADDALEVLMEHDWPGNVRELENLMMKLCVTVSGDTISLDDVLKTLKKDRKRPDYSSEKAVQELSFEKLVEMKIRIFLDKMGNEVEKEKNLHPFFIEGVEKPLIRLVLERTGWNRVKAARILGINRNTLHAKMEKLGIIPPRKTGRR